MSTSINTRTLLSLLSIKRCLCSLGGSFIVLLYWYLNKLSEARNQPLKSYDFSGFKISHKNMFFKRLWNFLEYWYLQYTLNTAVYMLEPTEVKIVNSILVATIAIFLYSAYVFLPGHAVMMMHFFEYLFSPNTDSTQVKVS